MVYELYTYGSEIFFFDINILGNIVFVVGDKLPFALFKNCFVYLYK